MLPWFIAYTPPRSALSTREDELPHPARLAAFRAALAAQNLAGFIVPIADEHDSEYVGAYAQRLHWLTCFTGSAGTAVVLADRAAFVTDGRYTLQAAAELGPAWERVNSVETPLVAWLGANVPEGARIGYDPWAATHAQASAWARALEGRGRGLVAVTPNPIDALWEDRPAPSTAPLTVHPLEHAGKSGADKRADIAEWLGGADADAAAVTTLDGVAWLMNLRGSDVARTPVGLAFALAHRDGTADLFVDDAKLTAEVRAHLGNSVRLAPYDAFGAALSAMGAKTVAVDPERASEAVFAALAGGGARVLERRDPTVLAKAIKNEAEIAGARAAHVRDGAALTRFLHWIATEAPGGDLDELTATGKLEAFRRATGQLVDLSFDTIMGSGRNGAIMHYRGTPDTNRRISPGELLLIDSGAQYADGTTDVTRTVAIGAPSREMIDRFTRVLKGHIAVASAIFPKGARGSQLDGMARRALWEIGTDYAHGTGHGVGSFLSVHEGPQRIASYGGGDEKLVPGMICSNEPGYYKPGHYGIRIESLVLVNEVAMRNAELPMLGFENLTLAPIDRTLIDKAMLTESERDWLNSYHALVRRTLAPHLEAAAATWLDDGTRPL